MTSKPQRISLGQGSSPGGILLNGRRECFCEAAEHNLINNCINCGRIVCEQEGSGPCFTCKSLVCTNEERQILNRDSKASAKLYEKLMGGNSLLQSFQKFPKESNELDKAIEHKNKLLEFNDTVEKRTKVIDDESDYFESDSVKWLSASVRKSLEEKRKEHEEARHGSRLNQKLTFDFAGRVVQEEKPVYDYDLDVEELLKDNTSIFTCNADDFVPSVNVSDYVPEYCIESTPRVHSSQIAMSDKHNMRIQDKELKLMSDDGFCLSINQPYASLLIAGIKLHEGRGWYTAYRGRLWIHASQKAPIKQEITNAEDRFRLILGEHLKLPKNYPTAVVLGCVDLLECLTQEEYREEFPSGDSASPYVFICNNPQELRIKFPMRGGKKIFKMESKFHTAAKRTLQKLSQ